MVQPRLLRSPPVSNTFSHPTMNSMSQDKLVQAHDEQTGSVNSVVFCSVFQDRRVWSWPPEFTPPPKNASFWQIFQRYPLQIWVLNSLLSSTRPVQSSECFSRLHFTCFGLLHHEWDNDVPFGRAEKVQKRASNVMKLAQENEKLKAELKAMTDRLEAAERRREQLSRKEQKILEEPSSWFFRRAAPGISITR